MCHKASVLLALRLHSNGYSNSLKSNSFSSNFNVACHNRNYLVQLNLTRRFCARIPLLQPSICKHISPSPQITSLNTFGNIRPSKRSYCSKREHELPKIMDFPQVIWPSIFKSVRNWILSNFIIMRYFDGEFSLPDFVIGSKQAVEVVSGFIARGDVDSLPGLVTPEVISQVRENLQTFTLKQRQEFAIRADDVFFSFPYEVGVMFPNEEKSEGENQSRFVEITMCYHAMLGLRELRESGTEIPMNMGSQPEYRDKIVILNYRFIREFTKGVQDDWTINAINHFKPAISL